MDILLYGLLYHTVFLGLEVFDPLNHQGVLIN